MNWTPKRLFQGRLKRFHFLIGSVLINFIMGSFLVYYFIQMRFGMYKTLWSLFALCLFCLMSLIVRRFHDMNGSGWWALLFFIPLFNLILLIYLFIYPGTEGENSYGQIRDRGVIRSILNVKK